MQFGHSHSSDQITTSKCPYQATWQLPVIKQREERRRGLILIGCIGVRREHMYARLKKGVREAVKDCINDEKQFVFACVLNSALHLNVFGRVNRAVIDKDSQCIYQLFRLSTLSHWTLSEGFWGWGPREPGETMMAKTSTAHLFLVSPL